MSISNYEYIEMEVERVKAEFENTCIKDASDRSSRAALIRKVDEYLLNEQEKSNFLDRFLIGQQKYPMDVKPDIPIQHIVILLHYIFGKVDGLRCFEKFPVSRPLAFAVLGEECCQAIINAKEEKDSYNKTKTISTYVNNIPYACPIVVRNGHSQRQKMDVCTWFTDS